MSPSLPAMVDLRGDRDGELTLSWTEAPGARNKVISPAELTRLRALADAVGLAESRGAGAEIVATRTALSAALFDLLDGPERALGQRIARAEAERRRLDVVVRAHAPDRSALGKHPATWMRWELLPFAEAGRRGALPFTVVLQLGSLAIQANVHGTEEHPSVAISLHKLSGVLQAQSDLAGARNALERSLAIQAKVHGTEEHPDVAASVHQMASILEAEGKLEEAAAHYRRVLSIEAKCFGTLDQYHSAETEVPLALLLFQLGRQNEAGELLQHALRVLAEQVPNHFILQQLRVLMQKRPG